MVERNPLSLWAAAIALPFFLLLAAGPFPLMVFGLLVDHIISALALGAVALQCILQPMKLRTTIGWCVALYLLVLLPSVLRSPELGSALDQYKKTFGYAALFFLFLAMRRPYVREIRIVSLVAFFGIGALIIYLYNFSDYARVVRFALSADYDRLTTYGPGLEAGNVDPNMTAFGMVLTFLCAFPLMLVQDKRGLNYLAALAVPVLVYVSAILMSRTAILCVALAAVLYVGRELTSRFSRTFVVRRLSARSVVVLAGVGITLYLLLEQDVVQATLRRFEGIVEQESETTGRLWLMERALNCVLDSVGNVLWGCGYAWSNPHNEFLRDLANSGFFSAASRIALLLTVWLIARRRAAYQFGQSFVVDMTFAVVTVMLLTYGHTKTFWFGLALIWLNGLSDTNEKCRHPGVRGIEAKG